MLQKETKGTTERWLLGSCYLALFRYYLLLCGSGDRAWGCDLPTTTQSPMSRAIWTAEGTGLCPCPTRCTTPLGAHCLQHTVPCRWPRTWTVGSGGTSACESQHPLFPWCDWGQAEFICSITTRASGVQAAEESVWDFSRTPAGREMGEKAEMGIAMGWQESWKRG